MQKSRSITLSLVLILFILSIVISPSIQSNGQDTFPQNEFVLGFRQSAFTEVFGNGTFYDTEINPAEFYVWFESKDVDSNTVTVADTYKPEEWQRIRTYEVNLYSRRGNVQDQQGIMWWINVVDFSIGSQIKVGRETLQAIGEDTYFAVGAIRECYTFQLKIQSSDGTNKTIEARYDLESGVLFEYRWRNDTYAKIISLTSAKNVVMSIHISYYFPIFIPLAVIPPLLVYFVSRPKIANKKRRVKKDGS